MKRIAMFISIITVVALVFSSTLFAQNDLTGLEWQLISIDGAEVDDMTTITLKFEADDRAGGSSGCNTYGSSYTVDGTDIDFTEVVNTMMACLTEGVMEQEQAYLSALDTATHFELLDGHLVITYDGGKQLVFAPLISLAGTSWKLQTLAGHEVTGKVTLVFDEGRVSGTGGCNSFNTLYTADGSALSFEPIVSTRVACADKANGEQETLYFAALEAAVAYEYSEDQLIISEGNGESLIFTAMCPLTWF